MRSLLIEDVKAMTKALFAADSFDSWCFKEGKVRRRFDVALDGDIRSGEEDTEPVLGKR